MVPCPLQLADFTDFQEMPATIFLGPVTRQLIAMHIEGQLAIGDRCIGRQIWTDQPQHAKPARKRDDNKGQSSLSEKKRSTHSNTPTTQQHKLFTCIIYTY